MSETAIRPVTADVGDGAPSRLGTAIGGGVALVVLGALVWWFFLRGIGPEVQANMLEMRSEPDLIPPRSAVATSAAPCSAQCELTLAAAEIGKVVSYLQDILWCRLLGALHITNSGDQPQRSRLRTIVDLCG